MNKLDVPVIAKTWREARRMVLDELRQPQVDALAAWIGDRTIRSTHTRRAAVSTPDLPIWTVTVTFA